MAEMDPKIDLLGNAQNQTQHSDGQAGQKSDASTLASIDSTLKELLKNSTNTSQSKAYDSLGGSGRSGYFRNQSRGGGSSFSQFTDAFEKEIVEAFLGKGFKQSIGNAAKGFAKELGVSLEDIPRHLGQQVGQSLMGKFKNTGLGKEVMRRVDVDKQNITNFAKNQMGSAVNKYVKTPSGSSSANAAKNLATKAAANSPQVAKAANLVKNSKVGQTVASASKVAMGAGKASAVASGTSMAAAGGTAAAAGGGGALAAGAGATAASGGLLLPVVVGVAVASVALKIFTKALGPATEGLKSYMKALGSAWKREETSRKANISYAKDRLANDVKVLIETPFKILEDAANLMYQSWDTNLRKINGTQGYQKADLQNLYGAYSSRLRSEGLSSVISSANVTDSLARVLDSGLSGQIAEEFAFVATKLEAAIPTQDFFSFAGTYSSVAANAMRNGASQSQAIQQANDELAKFANNLLYASRDLSGGFSTGLKDASKLFQQSQDIVNAAGGGSASNVSGVLTAVAGITGAIAPELATAMTDSVYKAALGGNDSSLVALRSLAGGNASNTEFLKMLSTDPKKVYSTMFGTLARYQGMGQGAFMERSEGLSGLFGMSMEAFTQVDFAYLAKAINEMNTNSGNLLANMDWLKSGETTTSAEMLRMQQVNEFMINEGLAFVLDNEAGRAIQQHMWNEQIARQLMETTYGVELQGAGIELLSGIIATVKNILRLLNPAKYIKDKVGDVIRSRDESVAFDKDIRTVLQLGKVGSGRSLDLRNLVTRNADLDLTKSLPELLGGSSSYNVLRDRNREIAAQAAATQSGSSSTMGKLGNLAGTVIAKGLDMFKYTPTGGTGPMGAWGAITKMGATFLSSRARGSALAAPEQTSSQKAASKSSQNFAKYLDTIGSYTGIDGGGYEGWLKASSKFGIADVEKAAKDSGYTLQQVQQFFEDSETLEGKKLQQELQKEERTFWANMQEYTLKIQENLLKFHEDWVDYFINHTAYSNSYDHAKVLQIQSKEKKGTEDAVFALADALTQNSNDLLSPTMQTNALLAQILKGVATLINQNNESSDISELPNTLSGLATGLIKQKKK